MWRNSRMQKKPDVGRSLSLIGSSLFLVIAAATIYSQYAERADTTKLVVFTIFAVLSGLLAAFGRWMRTSKAKKNATTRVSRSARPDGVRL
jgi:hypothetical protein